MVVSTAAGTRTGRCGIANSNLVLLLIMRHGQSYILNRAVPTVPTSVLLPCWCKMIDGAAFEDTWTCLA